MAMPHLPDTVDEAGLARIPEPYRDAYLDLEGEGKSWRKSRQLASYIAEQLAEIERLKGEIESAKATHAAELSHHRAKRDEETVSQSLRAALAARGVKPALTNAAAALLRERVAFEVEDNDYGEGRTVVGKTPDNFLVSVDGAVESFLQSDEGAPFAPASGKPSDGYFQSLIAGLKQRR